MKVTRILEVNRHLASRGLYAVGGWLGLATILLEPAMARADAIPYPNAGTPNPVSYIFTATSNEDIIAYFAGGAGAGDDNLVGLLINGVSTGVVGLDNHTSSVGQSFNLGHANAGDTLVFMLQNNTVDTNAYSDPALNGTYDSNDSAGHNHAYATPYTATDPVLGSIPTGTYVAFEDIPFPGADFNYNDEAFVVTGVNVTAVPEPATWALAGLGCLAMAVRRFRK